MTAKIYVLLPAHNRREVTRKFVESLKAQTFGAYHLVLIDDGSTDGTAEMVRDLIPDATVLHGKGDWWWAGSLQQGIAWLERNCTNGQDIVMFANDDITFDVDFLQRAYIILDGLEATLLLPYLRNERTGLPEESGVEADLRRLAFNQASSPEKINCLSTRGLFMRMSDLSRIGGFHPWLLPHYLSDYEFTIRARRKGLRLMTSSDIAINLDREKTGYRSFEDSSWIEFIYRYFSKKNVSNPLYWSTFILMVVPMRYVLGLLFKVWFSALKKLALQTAKSAKL